MSYWEKSKESLDEWISEVHAKFPGMRRIIDKMQEAYLQDIDLFSIIKGNEKAVAIFVKLRELESEFDRKTLSDDYELRKLARLYRENVVRSKMKGADWGSCEYGKIIKEYMDTEDELNRLLS